MLGAIIGDIIGSRFEWHNIKSKEFELFSRECRPTDDSIMTLAIAKAILSCDDGNFSQLGEKAVRRMQEWGNCYPCAGYGGAFMGWLTDPDPHSYGSYGNGAAMRVSPCAYAAGTLDEALELAKAVTEVTHNHPEGIKGALATTAAIFMALHGSSIEEIREHIDRNYYPMDFTLDKIRPTYRFDVSCQGSVPQAIMAFLESTGFEDAIRNAISIGGDSDTIAAIAGSIAGAYYGIPDEIRLRALSYLDEFQFNIVYQFENQYRKGMSETDIKTAVNCIDKLIALKDYKAAYDHCKHILKKMHVMRDGYLIAICELKRAYITHLDPTVHDHYLPSTLSVSSDQYDSYKRDKEKLREYVKKNDRPHIIELCAVIPSQLSAMRPEPLCDLTGWADDVDMIMDIIDNVLTDMERDELYRTARVLSDKACRKLPLGAELIGGSLFGRFSVCKR